MNFRKNMIIKKTYRYLMHLPRMLFNLFRNESYRESFSPVICNSFPKSGTNLLLQVLQCLPNVKDWGLFLASMPSITYQERSAKKLSKKINSISAGELVGAHIFYSDGIKNTINDRNIIHYFIYRDLRDVVISEAHYLTDMNRWHRLHKYYKALLSMEDRISFSITGAMANHFPYNYPNIAERFNRYKKWLDEPDVFTVKYEDLNSDNVESVVRNIIRFYIQKSNKEINEDEFVKKALMNINPEHSHTFRTGKSGNWKHIFTESHKDLMKKMAGNLLIELGYEKDLNW